LGTQKDKTVEPLVDIAKVNIFKQLKISVKFLVRKTWLLDHGVELLYFDNNVAAKKVNFSIKISYNANEAAAAAKGESAPAGLGKLETIGQISAAMKELLDTKAPA
jgi:hypothetical protein